MDLRKRMLKIIQAKSNIKNMKRFSSNDFAEQVSAEARQEYEEIMRIFDEKSNELIQLSKEKNITKEDALRTLDEMEKQLKDDIKNMLNKYKQKAIDNLKNNTIDKTSNSRRNMKRRASSWEYWGDVNPLDHGGYYYQNEGGGVYRVIEVRPDEESFYSGGSGEGVVVIDMYVETNDDWIEVNKVCDYADTTKDSGFDFVQACISYYGPHEFQGDIESFNSHDEAINALSKRGINIK